jgi:hypothetical protein
MKKLSQISSDMYKAKNSKQTTVSVGVEELNFLIQIAKMADTYSERLPSSFYNLMLDDKNINFFK